MSVSVQREGRPPLNEMHPGISLGTHFRSVLLSIGENGKRLLFSGPASRGYRSILWRQSARQSCWAPGGETNTSVAVGAGPVVLTPGADRHQSIIDVLPRVAHARATGTVTKRIAVQNKLSRVVDALSGMVWTALPDGHIDFLNRRWCEYTGLSKSDGIGIGLSVGHCIIGRHHGRLWAAPNDGQGATFSFSISRGPKCLTGVLGNA